MRDLSNMHQKIQEMCDCHATCDPLHEMSKMQGNSDEQDAAVKWAALVILHGLNNNAEEISIEKTKNGDVKVIAEYRRSALPEPPAEVSDDILEAFKSVLHIDSSQGESTLAFGFRNNSFDLKVRTREEGGDHKVTIKFP
jgi:hypothetical protein